jgi:uncharacterized UPF0160 family protein
MKKIVTHNGAFHADEVFAVATLCLVLANDFDIVRSRDEEIIKSADVVVDVGGVYDELKDRFDHHQKKSSGKRKNGIPYASFGLVWKKYGLVICGNEKIVEEVDSELVAPIDAGDNGIDVYKVTKYKIRPFTISDIVHSFNSTWKEIDRSQDEVFMEVVDLAKKILKRSIDRAKDKHEALKFIDEAYEKAEDKRVIVIDKGYPTRDISLNYIEPLFVVKPNQNGKWNIETIREDPKSFKSKIDLPHKWGGLNGKELQKITGVKDAVFCHKKLFLAVTDTKEGALELVYKALEEKENKLK